MTRVSLRAALTVWIALLACGGGSTEYERHDTGLGIAMSLPTTCKRSGPNDFQCAGGSAQGGTDLHFEASALSLDALEREPLSNGRASGTVPWSGRIKAGTLDAVEVGVFESSGVAKQHWLAVVAGPKSPVLFHVTVRHIQEAGPRRENLFWRRLLGSLEPKP